MTSDTGKHVPGKLILVPAPLDFGCDQNVPIGDVLPLGVMQTASQITHWVCENAKTARAVLKRMDDFRADAQKQREAGRDRWLAVYDSLNAEQKEKARVFFVDKMERTGKMGGRDDRGHHGHRDSGRGR